jgi:large subunit ribosomal protein L21
MENLSTYAVVRAKGKQLLVRPGDIVTVDQISAAPGQEVLFEDILVVSRNGKSRLGVPVVEGAQVAARVIRHTREAKLVAFKRMKRTGFKKKRGHRQNVTMLKIENIIG